MFTGIFTALVTPFTESGAIDENVLRRLVDIQIEAGVQGIVPVGSTGESPTLSHAENIRVIEIVIEQSAGRIPVIAGTGSNCTTEAIEMTRRAKALGADATLQIVPYYIRPNQEGLYKHFREIAEACELPVILYNHPGRTGRNLEPETIMKLSKHKNIVGIKDSSGNLSQVMEIISNVPADFSILSGDDIFTLPIMSVGGHGVISVTSNLAPTSMVSLYKAISDRSFSDARRIHYQLLPLFKATAIDINPVPIKYMLSRMGLIHECYRLPLTPLSEQQKNSVDLVMQQYNNYNQKQS